MNVTFWTNATGTWGLIGYNDSVYNGTYSQTNESMSNYNTKYWWSVNVTDNTTWNNVTYNFTTATQTNTTAIIRPSGVGRDGENLANGPPGAPDIPNWEVVDEETANDDEDFVYTSCAGSYVNDTYAMQDREKE